MAKADVSVPPAVVPPVPAPVDASADKYTDGEVAFWDAIYRACATDSRTWSSKTAVAAADGAVAMRRARFGAR